MSSQADASRPQAPDGVHMTDPEVFENPYPHYEALQRSCPVSHDSDVGWLVTRYDDLRSAVLNTKDLSSSIAGADGPRYMGVSPEPLSPEVEEIIAKYEPMENALFTADPPVHTRHRAIVTKALNPRRVRQLEGYMREIAEELVDAFIADGRCELNKQFAVPLPLIVISDTLGISREDLDDFKYWSDCMVAGDLDPMDNEKRAEVGLAVIEFQKYMIPLINERREEPRDDLLSDLTNTEIDDDDNVSGPRRLSTAEILPIISQILLAGNETTTSLIGNGLVILIEQPELMAELRSDHDLIPDFIEEALRMESPAMCSYRVTTTEVEIGGQTIPAGEMVVGLFGAANQDEEVFENPRTFDMKRPNLRRHLAFGAGPHFCPGAEMARVEARVAFEVLFNRLDQIRLAPGAELHRDPTFTLRTYHEIPLEFAAKGA
ncbi:MAG: cytochrome P450 [Actinobacteria bacterium]|nr:cytochrome P450 [Actinomycetota bacterium]